MILKSFLPFAKRSQLLVCETDGFSLRGAVVARVGAQVEVLYRAKIEQCDMTEALADLVGALKADGWRGGGAAVLLSPAVLSTLVELPVNPKKPRPVPQMMELVRWEVEPLLMQHATRWSVGQLAVARGYMTEEQTQAVLDLQQGQPNKVGGLALSDQYVSRRFGELAEDSGYIKRSQLNACLTAQEWLKADDERIECGWAAQGPVEDVPGTFSWLVSCINQSLLQRWKEIFARHGVKLRTLFPSTGCSTALLPKQAASGMMLESHRGLAFGTRLSDGRITAQHRYANSTKSPLETCLESYHALHGSPNESLWLACWHGVAGNLIAELRQMLQIEIQALDDSSTDETLSPGMWGAARHALGVAGQGRCIGVREGGPPPPLPQRLEVRAGALAGLLLISIAGAELSLTIRKDAAEARKGDVDARWKTVDDATKRINARIKEIEKRKQALAEQKADQVRLEAMLDFYGHAIPERVALVQGVLGVLQNTVTDEVLILRIDESAKNARAMPAAPASPAAIKDERVEVENFNVDAWAISEAAAQTFIQKMKEAVVPWHLEVRDAQVSSRPGPLNLEGFAVSMRLVKLVEADTAQVRQKERRR